jgi:hypothetical protein
VAPRSHTLGFRGDGRLSTGAGVSQAERDSAVLDNFEHLLPAADLVANIVAVALA